MVKTVPCAAASAAASGCGQWAGPGWTVMLPRPGTSRTSAARWAATAGPAPSTVAELTRGTSRVRAAAAQSRAAAS
ncbi:hypothetical protein [Streptomyces sp. NPDC049949]|uniref:hypothetical protein n=1 Tax=Streptomyces sp. NPDC049949 TaxID=3154627 RepID=UPI003430CA61